MIKLLAIGDLALRGVSFSRLYPLERLTENGYPVTVKVRNKYPVTSDIEWCDVVYFLRALNLQDLQFLKMCKLLNKKIWIDSDDDIINVPIDHSEFFNFTSPGAQEAYIEIHKIADAISYSTREMFDSHKKYNLNGCIIPCAYPDETIERYTEHAPVNKLVMWRGTDTHQKSLLEFTPAVLKVANANPEWSFVFIGVKPWTIVEKMKNSWRVEPFLAIDDLIPFINQRRPAVHMVVRTDNQFTRARSCVSYVEASFGGAVTVAPNWGDWKQPGIVNYKTKDDFVSKMNTVMRKSNKTAVSASVKHIKATRTWSKINDAHYKILEKLCSTH